MCVRKLDTAVLLFSMFFFSRKAVLHNTAGSAAGTPHPVKFGSQIARSEKQLTVCIRRTHQLIKRGLNIFLF